MRFPKRTDIDNELSRTYIGADGFEYTIVRPTAVYYDPEDANQELILDSGGRTHLVPKIGGRTAVACHIEPLPGTDEPLT